MIRPTFNVLSILSAALFALSLAVWMIHPRIEWEAGQPQWFSFVIMYGDKTPEITLMVARIFLLNDLSIVIPMIAFALVCLLWLAVYLLRRKQSTGRGFPVSEGPPAAS